MEFTEFDFLTIFLPLTMIGAYFFRTNQRNLFILILSYLFYAWGNPYSLCVILALTLSNYLLAFKKPLSILAILINITTLICYKYIPGTGFPLGLSFYIFQLISYQIDVYRNTYPAERNLYVFSSYVAFFPKMITGPIARYNTFPADFAFYKFDINTYTAGIERFCIGLAKKVLIANVAAQIADCIFGAVPETVPTVYCWLGAFAYTIQIYFDFAGCTDMAIGLGMILGYSLPENFNYPYSAKSIQDFWRRWHISLSLWFRDYLYIPLGGNRKGKTREYINMFIVFLLCGAWHGATLTFVVWGAYHGMGITIEKMGLKKVLAKLPNIITNVYVLLFTIIGWVIFRSETIEQAITFFKHMFFGNALYPYYTFVPYYHIFSYSGIMILLLGYILSYPIAGRIYNSINSNARLFIVLLLFVISYFNAITTGISPSIYGKF